MTRIFALAALLLATPVFAADLPTPDLTPGATNPAVTQDNIDKTICVHGWTATVRPPARYTSALKRKQMKQYGLAGVKPSAVEEDHFIPLGSGGNPTSPLNLWPQRRSADHRCHPGDWTAECKDLEERDVQIAICQRRITLKDAQALWMTNWVAGFYKWVPQSEIDKLDRVARTQ